MALRDVTERARKNGKRWGYYASNAVELLVPRDCYRRRLDAILSSFHDLSEAEKTALNRRVNYYNKLSESFEIPPQAIRNDEFSVKSKHSTYHFDLYDVAKYFPGFVKYSYQFGDVTKIPLHPSFVKSRPIDSTMGNCNSIVLKMDKVRHYYRVPDCLSYEEKKPLLVWRGAAHQKHRLDFLSACYDSPVCDVGATDEKESTRPFRKPFLSLWRQLEYKFIFSIEGNDVATNLKWIFSSNSLCFMRKPRYETWFMEGELLPGVHYVCLKDDYSDLEEKVAYYACHPKEAKNIIENANRYVEQFYDDKVEKLVSLMVFEKYLKCSGQI